MRSIRCIVLAFALMLGAGVAEAQTRKVLVIAELGGQHVEFTQRGLAWLRDGQQSMDYEMTEINDMSHVEKGWLNQFSLIIQLNYPPYMWSDAAQRDFESYIDNGKGSWIGFHHASLLGEFDGFPMWQWFSDFMGGIRFDNYIAEKADGTVQVEDRSHPVMQGVPGTFVIAEDEFYTYDKSPRPNTHVLAHVDEASYTPASKIKMGDHPVIWVNPGKEARNVYFQIGHSASLFDNDAFVKMFQNAIHWGLKD